MKKICFWLLFCVIGWSDTLKIGILPYTDALKIISIHQPLKQHLATALGDTIEIYSANSYENFYKDTSNGEFDVVVTGPHFGMLHIQNGFVPLFRYNTTLKPVFVVLKESPYTKVKDLKNKKLSLSNYLSVSSMGGIKTLMDEGFKNGIDFKLLNFKSHTSAIMSVILGESDAAITTHTPILQLTDAIIKNKIRIFESDFDMPHLFTIANPKLSKDKLEKIKEALSSFQHTVYGKEFFAKTGYKGYMAITPADLDAIKPLLAETKGFLANQ